MKFPKHAHRNAAISWLVRNTSPHILHRQERERERGNRDVIVYRLAGGYGVINKARKLSVYPRCAAKGCGLPPLAPIYDLISVFVITCDPLMARQVARSHDYITNVMMPMVIWLRDDRGVTFAKWVGSGWVGSGWGVWRCSLKGRSVVWD